MIATAIHVLFFLAASSLSAKELWENSPPSIASERLPVFGNSSTSSFTLLESGPFTSQAAYPSTSVWQTSLNLGRHEASDFVPVRQFSREWGSFGPRKSEGLAFHAVNLNLSAVRNTWELGVWYRQRYVADAANGALLALNAYKKRLDPPDQQSLDLRANVTGINQAGLRIAKTLTWALGPQDSDWLLHLTGAFNTFSLQRLSTFSSGGELIASAGLYQFNASAIRRESARSFDGFGADGTTGYGHSADFGLMIQPRKDLFLNLSAVDLLSTAQMNNVATESALLKSDVKARDSEGYLVVGPSVIGQKSGDNLKLQIKKTASILAGWRIPPDLFRDGTIVGIRHEQFSPIGLTTFWLATPISQSCIVTIERELSFRSFGIGMNCSSFKLMIRSSSLQPSSAQSLGWALSAQKSW